MTTPSNHHNNHHWSYTIRTNTRHNRLQTPLFLVVVALFLCLLLLVQFLPAAAGDPLPLAPGLPTNLTIGFAGPLTKKVDGSALPAAQLFGQPALFCYNIALAEINNSTEWLPYTTLFPFIRDTKFDEGEDIAAALDFAAAGVVTVIGDVDDITSMPDALKRYRIPQVSPNSYLGEFSRYHDLQYPYFMRNSYPWTTISLQHMRLLQALGYKRATVIYSNDAYSISGSIIYFTIAPKMGIELVGNPNYFAGETDWSSVISRIVKAEARIIIWLGNVIDIQSIWRYAIQQDGLNNICGDGYLWLLEPNVAAARTTHDASGNAIPELAQAAAGQIGLMIVDNTTLPEVQAFERLYHATPYDNITTPSVHPENPALPPPQTCRFAYDAMWQAARALHKLIYEEQIDPTLFANRPHLMSTMLNITFTGASGPVVLDSTGDRQTNFAIVNYKRASSSFERVGYLGPGEPPVITMDPGASFEWPGSDPTKQPPDSPVRGLVTISLSVKIAMIVVASVIILICIGLQIFIIIQRDHRVLRASSSLFLIIYLIGIQLLCASVIPRSMESDVNASPSPCNVILYLTNLGYTLIIGSLLVKTVRLQLIFETKDLHHSARRLSDSHLLIALFVILVIELTLLLGLSEGLPLTIQLYRLNDTEDYYVCRTSNQSTNQWNTIYLPVITATRFAFLVVTTFVAFRVRNLPDTFNESKQLGLTIYNLLFLSVLLPAIDGTLGRGQDTPVIAYSVSVFVICIVSVAILFVPKILVMYVTQTSRTGMVAGVERQNNPITSRPTEKREYREAPTVSDGSIDLSSFPPHVRPHPNTEITEDAIHHRALGVDVGGGVTKDLSHLGTTPTMIGREVHHRQPPHLSQQDTDTASSRNTTEDAAARRKTTPQEYVTSHSIAIHLPSDRSYDLHTDSDQNRSPPPPAAAAGATETISIDMTQLTTSPPTSQPQLVSSSSIPSTTPAAAPSLPSITHLSSDPDDSADYRDWQQHRADYRIYQQRRAEFEAFCQQHPPTQGTSD